jgi:WD40 repeat protein
VRKIEDAHTESILDIVGSGNGMWIVTGGKDKCAKLWRSADLGFVKAEKETGTAQPLTPLAIMTHAAATNTVAITPTRIITGSGDRTIKIWDFDSSSTAKSDPDPALNTQTQIQLNCLHIISAHQMGVASISLSPDMQKLVSGSSDKTMRVFDIETGVEEVKLMGHESLVRRVAVVPSSSSSSLDCILSGSYDEHVFLWRKDPGSGEWDVKGRVDIKRMGQLFGEQIGTETEGDARRVFSVKSDGRRVFACGQMNVVASWDLDVGGE